MFDSTLIRRAICSEISTIVMCVKDLTVRRVQLQGSAVTAEKSCTSKINYTDRLRVSGRMYMFRRIPLRGFCIILT